VVADQVITGLFSCNDVADWPVCAGRTAICQNQSGDRMSVESFMANNVNEQVAAIKRATSLDNVRIDDYHINGDAGVLARKSREQRLARALRVAGQDRVFRLLTRIALAILLCIFAVAMISYVSYWLNHRI
jgi:hypothetical protein